MKIVIHNDQDDLILDKGWLKALVKESLDCKEVTTDEISFYFVSKDRISELHDEFFDDPSPTDCITFPIDPPGEGVLGEVFVCPAVAIEYDSDSPYREVALYIVHGILHLLGYDDLDPSERRKMRRAEKEIMNHLEKKGLLL